MILSLFAMGVVAGNALLLVESLTWEIPAFTALFIATQGIVSWLCLDEVNHQVNKTFPGIQPRQESLPPAQAEVIIDTPQSVEKTESLFSPVADMPQDIKEDIQEPLESPYIFAAIEKAPTGQSDLQFFDQCMADYNDIDKKLVLANFQKNKEQEKKLVDVLVGQAAISDVLCKEISPGTDLIPYTGDLTSPDLQLAAYYIQSVQKDYDKIVFLLPKQQLRHWQVALESFDFSTEKEVTETFQPVQL
jgi:hypothetical protein